MTDSQRAICELLMLPDEASLPPRRHRLTQPSDESKAEATWRHCVAVYLGDHRGWHGAIVQKWVRRQRRRGLMLEFKAGIRGIA